MKLKHISTKFILAFVGVLSIVFGVLIVVFQVGFRWAMNDYIKENSFSMQEELDRGVSEVVNESAYLYGRIMSSSNVELLNGISDETRTETERTADFDTLMSRVGINEEYFNNVAIFTGEMLFSVHFEAAFSASQYQSIINKKNAMTFVGNENGSLVMGIYSSGGISDFNGIVLFYMSERKLSEMCNPIRGVEGYSFIMRSDGYIISHQDSSLVGKMIVYSDVYNPANAPEYKTEILNGKRSIVVTGKAQLLNARYGFDCCIVSVLDYGYYFGNMDMMSAIVLGVSIGGLCIAVLIAVIRANKISKPLSRLSASINATAEPIKKSPSVLDEGDELQQLERNYDAMMDRIFALVERNKEDMHLQRKLELESLQMQINPHFLYNTLDAISWMARMQGQPEIDRLVMNLAKFFRLFLHGGDKFVTVADEVEIVKSYLEIDKIRFPDRVQVCVELQKRVEEQMVLKLILQPIIENCLKYAFVSKHGHIFIRASMEGEDILLEVEDDGEGFDIPEDLFTRAPKKEGGYGLMNVNERIKLQYGSNYGLTVKSEKGKGTLVQARLKKL